MKVIEQKIRSLYHSTVFLWLVSACIFLASFEFASLVSLFLAAILNKFPLFVDQSVTCFLLCARVFSPAATILESDKTVGTRLLSFQVLTCLLVHQKVKLMLTIISCMHFKPYLMLVRGYQ